MRNRRRQHRKEIMKTGYRSRIRWKVWSQRNWYYSIESPSKGHKEELQILVEGMGILLLLCIGHPGMLEFGTTIDIIQMNL